MSQDSPEKVVRDVQQRVYTFARGMRNAAYRLQENYNTARNWDGAVLGGEMAERVARSFRHALGVYGDSKYFLENVQENGDVAGSEDFWEAIEGMRDEGPLEEFVHPADISERVDREEPYAVMDAHEILLHMDQNPLDLSIYVEALDKALLDFARLTGKIKADMGYSDLDRHPLDLYLDTLKAREEKEKVEEDLEDLADDLGRFNDQIDYLFCREDPDPEVWRWSADNKLEEAHQRYQALIYTLGELAEIPEKYGKVTGDDLPNEFQVEMPSLEEATEEALRFLENAADLQYLGVETRFDPEEDTQPEELDKILRKLED